METSVEIHPMAPDAVMWRCLHSGPIPRDRLGDLPPGDVCDWPALRARNLPLLNKITDEYGACALLAWHEDRVVGFLRFYPKALTEMPEAGGMCLQQAYPAGPMAELAAMDLPEPGAGGERTLCVHCLMTGSPQEEENPYQRHGLGTRLAQRLVEWGAEHGWQSIETSAYHDLPLVYEITGQTGLAFWSKLGFEVVDQMREPDIAAGSWFANEMIKQASAQGIGPDDALLRFTMRRRLA